MVSERNSAALMEERLFAVPPLLINHEIDRMRPVWNLLADMKTSSGNFHSFGPRARSAQARSPKVKSIQAHAASAFFSPSPNAASNSPSHPPQKSPRNIVGPFPGTNEPLDSGMKMHIKRTRCPSGPIIYLVCLSHSPAHVGLWSRGISICCV